jgi:hypothetical protein
VLGRNVDPLYPVGELVGKSTTQVGRKGKGEFTSGDVEVYDKWTQALGSVAELVSDAVYCHKESPIGRFVTAILPVLVVSDETLWVADYTEDGQTYKAPYKLDEALLFVGRDYYQGGLSFTISHLHICTRRGISQLLERVANDKEFWDKVLPTKEIDRT